MALVKLLFDVPSEFAELIGEVLIGAGAGGVEEQMSERGGRLVVYGEQEAGLTDIAERAQSLLHEIGIDPRLIHWQVVTDANSNWETEWTRYLVQQPLTASWVIQPEWDSTPAPGGMGRILIRPVLAFGDGGHATTRLAAEAVEFFCTAHPGSRVLDIGTGTGVLALVAALSGARTVVGTDIEPTALAAAGENAQLNGLSERVEFRAAGAPISECFDLVVGNLEPRTLLQLKDEIALQSRHARKVVLTGFLSEQAAEISAAFCSLGMTEVERVEHDGWSLLALVPAT